MEFHSHELGVNSFPSEFDFYFSVACVLVISFGFVLFFFQ